jgi:hypothetical protein
MTSQPINPNVEVIIEIPMPANSKLVVFIYLFEILTASSVAALPPDPFRGFGLDLLNLAIVRRSKDCPKVACVPAGVRVQRFKRGCKRWRFFHAQHLAKKQTPLN